MRSGYVLIVALAAGLILRLSGVHNPISFCGWLLIATAAGSLISAVVLACDRKVPEWCGRTALGQALLSEGALVMGMLTLAGNSIGPAVGGAASAIGVVAFIAGLRVESQARRLAQAAGRSPR